MYLIFSCLGRFCRVLSLYTLALGLYVTSAHAQTFSPPNSISSTSTSATYPTLVVDALGHINMAWIDSISGIIFARYSDTSQSFVAMPIDTNSVGAAFQPQTVVDPTGNIIEIAWAKPSATSGKLDVFVSRLTASGSTFLVIGTTQVSTTSVVLVSAPRLAFDGAGVDVVWGNTDTWIAQSLNGLTFSAPIKLSTAAQDSGGPRIAVDKSGNIFVAWTDRLAQIQNLPGNYCTNPIAGNRNANGIVTVYTNTFGGNYYINETIPSGTVPPVPSSANTRNLSNTDFKGPDPSYPNGYYGCSYDSLHLFFDQNDNLHLLWADDQPLEDLLTSTAVPQTNGPLKFTFPIGLVGGEGVSSPSVAADINGSIYAAWASGARAPSTTQGIYFARSDDDGANFVTKFSPEATVVSTPGAISPAYPQIAVDSNRNVDIVWEQVDPAGSGNTFHLFFARSTDRGDTFPTIREVSTTPSVLCIPPTPSGTTPPNTPNTTTCGTVQMGLDANSNGDIAWVENDPSSPGSSTKIDFSMANVANQPPIDFSISVTSPMPNTFSGQTVAYTVTATAVGGFNSAITLGCNDFQEVMGTQGRVVSRSDYSCTASGPLTPGGTATVSMLIPPDLPSDFTSSTSSNPYPFAINGTSGGTTHRVMVLFNDQGPAGSVQPSSAMVAVGASATFNVNIINFNAFSGNVNLACSGQPAWIQCGFNPPSVTPSSSSSVLTVTVVSAPTGSVLSYPPSVRGLPGQRNVVLWSATGTALCLLAVALVFGGCREGLNAPILLRRFAVMALTLVLATGLISCGGGAAAPSNGATSTSSGTGNGTGSGTGGGSTQATATFMVQAQAGNGTTNLGRVSITTK